MQYEDFIIIESDFLIGGKYLHNRVNDGCSMFVRYEKVVIKPNIVASWLEAADIKIRNSNLTSFVGHEDITV